MEYETKFLIIAYGIVIPIIAISSYLSKTFLIAWWILGGLFAIGLTLVGK